MAEREVSERGWVAFWSPVVGDWIFLDETSTGHVEYKVLPHPLTVYGSPDFGPIPPRPTLRAFIPNGLGCLEEVPGVTTAIGEFVTKNGSVWRAVIDLRGIDDTEDTCRLRMVEGSARLRWEPGKE